MKKSLSRSVVMIVLFFISIVLFSCCSPDAKASKKYGVNIFDAAVNGDTTYIASYIKTGCDVDLKNKDGVTALMLAAYFGQIDAMRLLIGAKADINAQDNNYGETALMMAASRGQTEAVKLLVYSGADLKLKNKERKTALIYANEKGFTDIVGILKKAGVE